MEWKDTILYYSYMRYNIIVHVLSRRRQRHQILLLVAFLTIGDIMDDIIWFMVWFVIFFVDLLIFVLYFQHNLATKALFVHCYPSVFLFTKTEKNICSWTIDDAHNASTSNMLDILKFIMPRQSFSLFQAKYKDVKQS